jgi:hypothetical protein
MQEEQKSAKYRVSAKHGLSHHGSNRCGVGLSKILFSSKHAQLYFALQNAFSAPTAEKYCTDLFEKLP